MTIDGKPYLLSSDESIVNPTAKGCLPEVLTPVGGAVPALPHRHLRRAPSRGPQPDPPPDQRAPELPDPGGVGRQRSVHYHDVDDPDDTTFAMLSMWNAGLRIVDVRDPDRPREVAYFNPGRFLDPNGLDGTSLDQALELEGLQGLDQAWGHVRYLPETGHMWLATRSGGFWVLELEPQVRSALGSPRQAHDQPARRQPPPAGELPRRRPVRRHRRALLHPQHHDRSPPSRPDVRSIVAGPMRQDGAMEPGDELDWETVAAAGLLTGAPDVEDRKELLRLLAKDGVTVPEMVEAQRHGALMRVVGERTIRPGAGTLTLSEVADRAGTDVEVVQRILRSLGAIVPEPDERTSAEDDIELVECALLLLHVFGEQTGWALLRRYGNVLERLTEAISAAVIREHPDISTVHSASEAVTARTWSAIAETVPRSGRLLDLASRHQIEAVRRYFEQAGAGEATAGTFVLGVGFADLSGYTAASHLLELQDIGGIVAEFEARAAEVVADHGGRVVKFVGDAAMFVSHDPDALVTIARTLVEPSTSTGPSKRGPGSLADRSSPATVTTSDRPSTSPPASSTSPGPARCSWTRDSGRR